MMTELMKLHQLCHRDRVDEAYIEDTAYDDRVDEAYIEDTASEASSVSL